MPVNTAHKQSPEFEAWTWEGTYLAHQAAF
jgi:hypothetical protein